MLAESLAQLKVHRLLKPKCSCYFLFPDCLSSYFPRVRVCFPALFCCHRALQQALVKQLLEPSSCSFLLQSMIVFTLFSRPFAWPQQTCLHQNQPIHVINTISYIIQGCTSSFPLTFILFLPSYCPNHPVFFFLFIFLIVAA